MEQIQRQMAVMGGILLLTAQRILQAVEMVLEVLPLIPLLREGQAEQHLEVM